MIWIINILKEYPELSIFLTLSFGTYLGKITIKGFKLGSVSGVLLVGILVGQTNISISSTIQSLFYLLFLFTLGYTCGPDFFNNIRKNGLEQIVFSIILTIFGILLSIAISMFLDFNVSQASGLAAGALTQTSILGLCQDALSSTSSFNLKATLNQLSVGFSVTYIIGTMLSSFLLSVLGPYILRCDLEKECNIIEKTLLNESLNNNIITSNTLNNIPLVETDVVSLSMGILLGALIGVPVLFINGFSLTLSISGGALIMGLLLGYIHSKHPQVAYIPKETVWFLNNIGISVFVAIIGINIGPTFINGIKSLGGAFIIAGILVTLIPILFGILLGKYVFKWDNPSILGSCAGALTTTAGITSICEKANSNIPLSSYSVTYSLGTIFLTLLSSLILYFIK